MRSFAPRRWTTRRDSRRRRPDGTAVTLSRAAARVRGLDALRYRAFRRVWLAAVCDGFGTMMERLAVGWFVLDSTGSVFLAALSFAVRSAPNMLAGAFGGAIADRFARPRVLMTTAALKALLLFTIGGIVLAGVGSAVPMLVLVVLMGVARASDTPSMQALITDIVGVQRATSTISLHTFGVRGVGLLGSLTGGVLLARVGPGAVFLLAAGAMCMASFVYSLVRAERTATGARRALWSDAIDGLRQILRIPVVLTLLLLALGVEVFAFSFQSLLPALAQRVLHVDAAGLGTLTFATGLGGVLGTIVLLQLADTVRRGRLLVIVMFVFAAALVALAASDRFELSLLLLLVIGATAAMFDALQWALLQASVPDDVRGRVIGAWMTAIGFGWLGPVTLGATAEALGTQWAVACGGAVVLALAVAAACSSGLRRL